MDGIGLEAGSDLRGIRKALERIADAIDRAFAEPAPIATSMECSHPERFDFGVTNGQPDWQCKVCGVRSIPQVEELTRG